MLGLNTAMGREGRSGLGALPGREQDFAAAFKQALDYAVAINGSAIHCMAGLVPPEQRPAARRVFIENRPLRPRLWPAEKNITLLLEPIPMRATGRIIS